MSARRAWAGLAVALAALSAAAWWSWPRSARDVDAVAASSAPGDAPPVPAAGAAPGPGPGRDAAQAPLPADAWVNAEPAALEALEAMARDGHLAASHALGVLLLDCRERLKTLPAHALEREASLREAGSAGVQQAERSVRLREQCQRVGHARADTGLAWIERAAAGGRAEARRAYADALVELARDDAWRTANARLLRDGGARAEAWMRDAAERGDHQAMVWLGDQLAADGYGAILPADPHRALVYQLAAWPDGGDRIHREAYALGEGPAPTPAERAAIEAEAARLRALIRPRD